MFKTFQAGWTTFKGTVSRILVMFAWLMPLSIGIDELDTLPAILCGISIIIGFLLVHWYFEWPKNWGQGRMNFTYHRGWPLLILIAVLLVLGDVFWLYHTKTSSDPFEEDPFAFIVLGILAFPLIEEFGFRLWTQSYLESKFNPFIAIITVSVVFSLFHKADMPFPQLLGGVFYGCVLLVTRSIWWGVFFHMLQNAILILSGQIPIVQEVSFQMMDRQDNLNLVIAITVWGLSVAFIGFWMYSNKHVFLKMLRK